MLASSAADDDEIDLALEERGVEFADGRGDLGGCAHALDANGIDNDPDPWGATAGDIEEVLDGRARGGSDDANGAWIAGDGPLAGGIEEALRVELSLERLKAGLKQAGSGRLDQADIELVLGRGPRKR